MVLVWTSLSNKLFNVIELEQKESLQLNHLNNKKLNKECECSPILSAKKVPVKSHPRNQEAAAGDL